jgi:hypothetical protein
MSKKRVAFHVHTILFQKWAMHIHIGRKTRSSNKWESIQCHLKTHLRTSVTLWTHGCLFLTEITTVSTNIPHWRVPYERLDGDMIVAYGRMHWQTEGGGCVEIRDVEPATDISDCADVTSTLTETQHRCAVRSHIRNQPRSQKSSLQANRSEHKLHAQYIFISRINADGSTAINLEVTSFYSLYSKWKVKSRTKIF